MQKVKGCEATLLVDGTAIREVRERVLKGVLEGVLRGVSDCCQVLGAIVSVAGEEMNSNNNNLLLIVSGVNFEEGVSRLTTGLGKIQSVRSERDRVEHT